MQECEFWLKQMGNFVPAKKDWKFTCTMFYIDILAYLGTCVQRRQRQERVSVQKQFTWFINNNTRRELRIKIGKYRHFECRFILKRHIGLRRIFSNYTMVFENWNACGNCILSTQRSTRRIMGHHQLPANWRKKALVLTNNLTASRIYCTWTGRRIILLSSRHDR